MMSDIKDYPDTTTPLNAANMLTYEVVEEWEETA